MKSFTIYIKETLVATHVTNAESKAMIMKSGFKGSESGWKGGGLYLHIGKVDPNKREGKGDNAVYIDYSNLKLNDSGQPEELSDNAWQKLRSKSGDVIDKKLMSLGYDGEVDGNVLRIFKKSLKKIQVIK